MTNNKTNEKQKSTPKLNNSKNIEIKNINLEIIKEYDIRGIWKSQFNEKTVRLLINAFLHNYKSNSIVVGHDIRNGSETIAKNIIDIAKRFGKVYDISLTTTPMFYFANFTLNADTGFMVTASHNPKQYNGIKTIYKLKSCGKKYFDKILKFANSYAITSPIYEPNKINIEEAYAKFIKTLYPKLNQSIIVDTMHGTAYLEAKILNTILEITPLHITPMPNFPITPDPSKDEHLKELANMCKEMNKIGIAFDGDGDRIRFVTEKGIIIQSDIIAALITKYEALKTIIITLNMSQIVRDIATQKDIEVIESKVGRSHVQELMLKHNADFGAEVSGHFFHKEFNFFDSGIISALKVLNIIERTKKTLHELIQPLMKYKKQELEIKTKDKLGFIEFMKTRYKYTDLDGILVKTNEYWFNIRASNTEDLLRVYIESEKESTIEKIKKEILSAYQTYISQK